MHRLAVLAVLLLPAVATAEPDPPSLYVEAAVGVGGVNPNDGISEYGGLEYEVAAAGRWQDLWIRAAVSEGQMFMNTDGHILEPRLGVEVRTSETESAVLFGGIDLGGLVGSADDEDGGIDTVSGMFAMPRGGLELGGRHVRFHLALEFLVGYGTSSAVGHPSTTGRLGGGNFVLGLSVR